MPVSARPWNGPALRVMGLFACGVVAAALAESESSARRAEMARAAQDFLAALSGEQRQRARMDYDDPSRLDWHYVPRERPGVALGELDPSGRSAAFELLDSALSERGRRKVEGILILEGVLRELERSERRDPGRYHLAVFGEPGPDAAWGWRLEGHHLSLNFSALAGEISVTPAFLGAQPAAARGGEHEGLRVLGVEEDLARGLIQSLSDEQRDSALRQGRPPADIAFGPGRELALPSEGLPASEMTEEQESQLLALIREYARNLTEVAAEAELARIQAQGMDSIVFLWIGETAPGRPHYWRIHGPTFVIEWDNVQAGGNHVHSVWRDRERDFGADLLARHRQEEHTGR